MRRNVFSGDHFPVVASDVITKFLMHGHKKLIPIRLAKGVSKIHCVGISCDIYEGVFTH